MALEDYLEPEVGIAVAATAAIMSPQVRGILRRGAVYGLAGLLRAGDAISGAAQSAMTQVQQAAASGVDAAQQTATEAQTAARSRRSTQAQ